MTASAETAGADRAIALRWLFHLIGGIHQPLHTAQLFTPEYPDRDRGGNEICIRHKRTFLNGRTGFMMPQIALFSAALSVLNNALTNEVRVEES